MGGMGDMGGGGGPGGADEGGDGGELMIVLEAQNDGAKVHTANLNAPVLLSRPFFSLALSSHSLFLLTRPFFSLALSSHSPFLLTRPFFSLALLTRLFSCFVLRSHVLLSTPRSPS
jgi:hypothetical protein